MIRLIQENKIIFILSIILLIPLISMFTEKNTSWELSLKPEDKEPFGTFVFDSLMRSEFGSRYQNVQSTIYEIHQRSTKTKSVIIFADYLNLPSDDIDEIIEKAGEGNKYIIAANNFNEDIQEKLEFEYANIQNINPFWYKDNPESEYSSIKIINEDSTSENIKVESGIVNSYFYNWDSSSVILLENENTPIAIKNRYNQGSVIICTSPYLFTNYFLLNKDCWKASEHLLHDFDSQEIVLTGKYMQEAKNEYSIFKNILKYRALKYLLYLSLALILLFMVFSAKRKQRIIPVIQQHRNNSLEFIKLIGRLYFLKGNHTDICVKKFNYLKDYLVRTHQINFNEENENVLYEKISIKTGISVKKIRDLFAQMNEISTKKLSIGIPTLHKLVEEMEKFYIKK